MEVLDSMEDIAKVRCRRRVEEAGKAGTAGKVVDGVPAEGTLGGTLQGRGAREEEGWDGKVSFGPGAIWCGVGGGGEG
jgi:hypothetical protein